MIGSEQPDRKLLDGNLNHERRPLRSGPVSIGPKPPVWRRWAAAAGIAAALGIGILVWHTSAAGRAERLLARAYTEYRPMEMRLPGAAYVPLRIVRADGEPPIANSPDLHEAEARILRGIETHPDDPDWLYLQGRADLLAGKPDEAIAELERAHALRENDSCILSDLGAAWVRKAGGQKDQGNALNSYCSAYEFLSQGARRRPTDPVLAFNVAMAAERIFAFNEARNDWEAYLRLDPTSGWATEAREHLDGVRKKLARQKAYAAGAAPDKLLAKLLSGVARNDTTVPDDEYLKVAETRLLPQFFGPAPDPAVKTSLETLASALIARHGDTWLRDVLKTPRSQTAADAFAMLGKAVAAADAMNMVASGDLSHAALSLFKAISSKPGILRATLAGALSYQMLGRNAECSAAIRPVRTALRASTYGWINAQTLLEEGTCQVLAHDFERGNARYDEALRVATTTHYDLLVLRALAFQASVQQALVGSTSKAWRDNASGLSIYWTGSYPLTRGQHFYSTFVLLAGASKIPRTAVAWARELADIASISGRPDFYGAAMYPLGAVESAASLDEDAVRHLRQAASAAPALLQ